MPQTYEKTDDAFRARHMRPVALLTVKGTRLELSVGRQVGIRTK